MNETKKGIILMHLCVVLWGFTAILGAVISIESVPLVFWRVTLSGAIMALIVLWQGWQHVPAQVWRYHAIIGVLVGVHWVAFYGAIKLANASVGVACMAMSAFFTAIFSPFLLRTRVNRNEIMLGLLIIPAMLLVVGSVDVQMQAGVWVGIGAAALVGVFTSYSKKLMTEYPETRVVQASMIQMWVISLMIGLFLPVFTHFMPEAAVLPAHNSDWLYLFLLAAFCTVLPFSVSLYAMKFISPFTSSLIINLEPVYGIFFAVVLLREDRELNGWFYVGVVLLFAVVFGHALWQRRNTVAPETR